MSDPQQLNHNHKVINRTTGPSEATIFCGGLYWLCFYFFCVDHHCWFHVILGAHLDLSLCHAGLRSAVQVLAMAIRAAEFDSEISQLLLSLADPAPPCQISMHPVYDEPYISKPSCAFLFSAAWLLLLRSAQSTVFGLPASLVCISYFVGHYWRWRIVCAHASLTLCLLCPTR